MQRKILLVEDENMIRDLYKIAFENKGYSVDVAVNGEEAIDKAGNRESNYDLILLDVMLPKVDGLTVLKNIMDEDSPSRNTPVFLLTNLGQENLIKEAINMGAKQYLVKSNYLPRQIVDEIEKFFSSDERSETSVREI